MIITGIEYVVIKSLFIWGGGRCAQNKVKFQKKIQICMVILKRNEKKQLRKPREKN